MNHPDAPPPGHDGAAPPRDPGPAGRSGVPADPTARRRPPAMSDVAALAGVSHQTVSRVLNDHPNVRPATRERVLEAISALGYRPNIAARTLATARSATLGVVTTGSALYGPTSTLIAVEEAAREQGWFVSVATIRRYDAQTMHRVLDHFMDQGVAGIVVIAPQTDVADAVDSFQAPVPVVIVADRDNADAGGTLSVAVDQQLGARLATEHLLDLGHETVMHIAGPQDWYDARQRVAGWRQALDARGVAEQRLHVATWTSEDGFGIGRRLAEEIAEGVGPTAIFASNDQLALGVLHAFWDHGVVVPRDVSLVGFDDIAGSAHFIPPLTTVRQPFAELGVASVGLLLAALDGTAAPAERIAPWLMTRETTAPPRHRR